jgi:GTP diphosphokinase / guanosine-3',5'-bis(diphosphate) 3'-diphosphatase
LSLFKELVNELSRYLDRKYIEQIHQAYLCGADAHAGQLRRSGEPYITHPLAVAKILAEVRMDPETIMAAILHDVIEDTNVNKATLAAQFGKQVAALVDGVSKLTQIKFSSREEAQAENFRKMVMAMSKDIRVIIVKLADRLHNMRTLGVMPAQKRRRIAQETLDIYVPIAKRLGMRSFNDEFEDLCFAAMHPMRYAVLEKTMRQLRGKQNKFIRSIEANIKKSLRQSKIKQIKVYGRKKHLYSIYRKMLKKQIKFSEVMDVYGFRIVVEDVDACYRVLGLMHGLYKPVPERFKDYIAIPKANGYQSLHTTLFGPGGIPIEIQIRTEEMDMLAANGIAAHWLYKSNEKMNKAAQKRARIWLNRLLEIQKNTGSSMEFIENVKFDLFPDEVYVFTPQGEIMELPTGACAVDFAYAVHSDVGNTCVAAKIDRQLVPLSSPLLNGQKVEIITAPGARPNPAWLNFVVTGKARSNIRHYLKSQKRAESISFGKVLLNRALANFSLSIDKVAKQRLKEVLTASNLTNVEDLYEAIGLGQQMPILLARRLVGVAEEEYQQGMTIQQKQHPKQSLVIKGSEGMVVKFSDCCNPIPGDPIVGVVDSGRGFVIHVEQCRKIKNLLNNPEKCIEAVWEKNVNREFAVEIRVEVLNKRGVLANLATAIADAEGNILNIHVKDRDGQYCAVIFSLGVLSRVHLARVMRRLRSVRDVVRLQRIRAV